MVRKVTALSNVVCTTLVHPSSLPSYVIGLAWLVERLERKFFSTHQQKIGLCGKHGKCLHTSMYGLVGQQHLKSHSESGSSGHLLWRARNKDQSREILKFRVSLQQGNTIPSQGWY